MSSIMTDHEKNEWLNKHLPYRFLMLVGYLIEQKNSRNNNDQISICLIEASYISVRGFFCFLVDSSLTKRKIRDTDLTIDKLGGRKISNLTETEIELMKHALKTCDKHVAHFTLELEENASDRLGKTVKLLLELLNRAMPEVEGFTNSKLHKLMIEHQNLPY